MKIRIVRQNNFDFYWIHSVHLKYNIGQRINHRISLIYLSNRKSMQRVFIRLYSGGGVYGIMPKTLGKKVKFSNFTFYHNVFKSFFFNEATINCPLLGTRSLTSSLQSPIGIDCRVYYKLYYIVYG